MPIIVRTLLQVRAGHWQPPVVADISHIVWLRRQSIYWTASVCRMHPLVDSRVGLDLQKSTHGVRAGNWKCIFVVPWKHVEVPEKAPQHKYDPQDHSRCICGSPTNTAISIPSTWYGSILNAVYWSSALSIVSLNRLPPPKLVRRPRGGTAGGRKQEGFLPHILWQSGLKSAGLAESGCGHWHRK